MPNAILINSNLVLPLNLYSSEFTSPRNQKTLDCFSFLKGILENLGIMLRDAFYLPLFKVNIPLDDQEDIKLAKKVWEKIQNPQIRCSEKLQEIKNQFFIRDINVHLRGPLVRTFTVRLFESKVAIEGKKLRVVLFSFNGNKESIKGPNTTVRSWDPQTSTELNEAAWAVMRVFQKYRIKFDSLKMHSLGNIVFSSPSISRDISPDTVIVDRGFTKTTKAAYQILPWPLSYILANLAELSGWSMDSEEGLLQFFQKHPNGSDGSPRKVIIIEAKGDHYFAEKGAFARNLHQRIARFGVLVFRAIFWPSLFHVRAHHAVSLDQVKFNDATEIPAGNTMQFKYREDQSMSSAIAENVIFAGDQEFHNMFCIGGNITTLDIGTMNDVLPLLSAFLEKGKASSGLDSRLPRAG